jgi:hypothetical protein
VPATKTRPQKPNQEPYQVGATMTEVEQVYKMVKASFEPDQKRKVLVRALNILRSWKSTNDKRPFVSKFAELDRISDEELLKHRNCGPATVKAIRVAQELWRKTSEAPFQS